MGILTYARLATVTLSAAVGVSCCGGNAASTSTSTPATTPNYKQNASDVSAWIAAQQRSDGAILYSSTKIEPYFANLAAIGWLADSSKIPNVEAWMRWYLSHLNRPDYNGINGTVYDYDISNGSEISTGTYDSADSYAATFLSLAEALWNTGDPGAQAFIKGLNEADLDLIGHVITGLQQANGLVYAKPDYPIEYLMDNSENYRGLADFALLATQAWNDTATTTWYNARAAAVQSGIQNVLYISSKGLYYAAYGSAAPDMAKWYPDATAQLYPIIYGVIDPASSQALTVYKNFNTAWPGWPQLSFYSQDSFPWCIIGYASYLMHDTTRTNAYINSIDAKYVQVTPQFPFPFYVGEAGWFLRTNAGLAGSK